MHSPVAAASKARVDGGVGAPLRHDSAHLHVSGQAVYTDDIPEPRGTLQVFIATSTIAHGRIKRLDVSHVASAKGVVDVVTALDIPGANDVSPVAGDDPVFADKLVEYWGQSIFAVAATSLAAARAAAALAQVEYEELTPILTIDDAVAAKSLLEPPRTISRGDPAAVIAQSPHKIEGRIEVGSQEHFYLEGMIALAVPGEGSDVTVHCSTQHPSEIQHKVAHVLGIASHAVTVECRRMGGGFGGKESQGNLPAAVAALFAKRTGRAAKVRYDRDDDFMMTGKRHDARIEYKAGFDDEGRILAVEFDQRLRCGMSFDLTVGVASRAMCHADNAYFLPVVRITSWRYKTHTQSNTAFRGFGGPQGAIGIERLIEDIAQHLGKDPLAVRRVNFYGHKDQPAEASRRVTPYGQVVDDSIIADIVDELVARSDYEKRRKEIRDWNSASPLLKRGISLTPVKFGISFNTTFLNQAAALVHVYADGSIMLNHGGTEMGQGLFTKVAQVVAEEFQVDYDRVKITSTDTSKVPNTSATAASSGSDLNGMAARDAVGKIKARLAEFLAERHQVDSGEVRFLPNRIAVGGRELPFEQAVHDAYVGRVPLSATGFYATPRINWDAKTATGRPFFYFAYGAAVSEVIIDTLTGENRILRVDILHDVGKSLNPALDRGQIEGAFVQGAGWLTTEELVWDAKGCLRTHAPSTYKIPACSDRAPDMRIDLYSRGENVEDTIYRSKAVGEPPFLLGISVLMALQDAVAAVVGDTAGPVRLDAPATPERVLNAVMAAKQSAPTRGQP